VTTNLAPLPVVVPLAAAAVLLAIDVLSIRRWAPAVAFAAAVAETAVAVALLHHTGSVVWFGGWAPRHGVAIGVAFTIDRIGAAGAVLGGGVVTAAVLATPSTVDDAGGLFYALLMTALAGIAGFCLSGDLFNMFVFFELMAVSAFALAAYRTRDVASLRAALSFAVTNSVGAFLVIIGIALLYARTGALNLAQIGRQLTADGRADRLVIMATTCVVVGFLIKAAIAPFHLWLVDTASSAPVPLVMVLAGVLDTLGVFAVARVYWTVLAPSFAAHHAAVRAILVGAGALTAVGAALAAVRTEQPRRRLAFVMISHTGVLLVGVGCLSAAGVAGAAVYAVGDGTAKAALVAGLARAGRAGGALLALGGLAVAGAPVFATALGKAGIDGALSSAGLGWVPILLVLTSALTGAAMLDLAVRVWRAAGEGGVGAGGVGAGGVGPVVGGAALLGGSAAAALLGRWAGGAAGAFTDTAGYAQRVLDGAAALPARAVPAVGFTTASGVADAVGLVGAVALTPLLARGVLRAVRRWRRSSPGDAVAWATVGAAAFATGLAVALR